MTTSVKALYNLDLERSLLGGLMCHPQLLARLDTEVEDFFSPKHQAVFIAMRRIDDREETSLEAARTLELLELELRRMGKSESVGGIALLSELAVQSAGATVLDQLATELVTYRARRELVAVLGDAIERVKTEEDTTAAEALDGVLRRLSSVRVAGVDPSRALGDLMVEEHGQILRDIEARARGEHVGGVPTGITALDDLLGGLPLGSVILVLGETGHGKSTLGSSFARAAADQIGDEPIIGSYEDKGRRFAQRALAQDSGIPTQNIRRRSFALGDLQRLERALRNVGARRERVTMMRGKTAAEFCAEIRRRRAAGPSAGRASRGKLVIADYLQAMAWPRGCRDERLALLENSQRLEDLAGEEDIAVVVFSQVNDEPTKGRAVKGSKTLDHRPRLRDGAGGRDAAKGAKVVLSLYRPYLYDDDEDPHRGEIILLKNNDGETRKVARVYLDLATHTIRDFAPTVAEAQAQLALGGG